MILEINFLPNVPATAAMRSAHGTTFYAAGSRFMGCATPESDWDFITQDTTDTRAFLTSLGFKELVDPEYLSGGNTSGVFQIQQDGTTIQVCLNKDVQVQRAVRDIISRYMLDEHRRMNRCERQSLWDTLYFTLLIKASGSFQTDEKVRL